MNRFVVFLTLFLTIILGGCDKSDLPEISNPNLRDTTRLKPTNPNFNDVSFGPSTVIPGNNFGINFTSNLHKALTNNKVVVKIGNTSCTTVGFYYSIDTSGKYYTYHIAATVPILSDGSYPVKVMVTDGSAYEYVALGQITIANSTAKKLYVKSMIMKTFMPDTVNSFNYYLVLYDKGASANLANSQTITLSKSGSTWVGNQTWNINPSIALTKYLTTGYEVDIYVNGDYKKTLQLDCSDFVENVTTTKDFATPDLLTPYDFTMTATFEWK